MHAAEMAEEIPLVSLNTSALAAARVLATRRLPGLVVADDHGRPYAILPASQVVRFLVPGYIQDDPSLARVTGRVAGGSRSRQAGRRDGPQAAARGPPELAVVNHDDTMLEMAAIMARLRSPLVAVVTGRADLGAITASRLLRLASLRTDRGRVTVTVVAVGSSWSPTC